MNLRRIATMYWHDVFEAIRDGRILIAVLLPVGLAIYYAVALPDPQARVPATLLVAGDTRSQLVEQVRESVRGSLELDVRAVRAGAIEDAVADDDDAVGLVAPRARPDDVSIVRSDAATTGAQVLEGAIREAYVGQVVDDLPPPLPTTDVESPLGSPFDRLGLDLGFGVFSIVMLALFIAFLAVPVLLMEEVTRRTLEALQLVATTAEIVVSKLLVGLTYCAIAVAITIPAAGLELEHPVAFVAWSLVLATALSGYGLVFGLALGDPGRVNTWSGIILLPLLVPAILALGSASTMRTVAELLPTGAGSQVLADAAHGGSISIGILPYVVLAAWTAIGIGLLAWMLDRREA